MLINGSVVATLAGVSGLLGLLSLLAYFLIGATGEDVRPFEVHGRGIDPSVIETLKQLKTDKAKIEWLQHYLNLTTDLAKEVVQQSKQFDPNNYAAGARKSRDKRYLAACVVFALIAILALLYEFGRGDQSTSDDQRTNPAPMPVPAPLPAASSATPTVPASGSASSAALQPVWSWMAQRSSGLPFSQVFTVETHNRHNMAQVGMSAFIRTSELREPVGAEKRITRATYRCEGHGIRCAFSKNPNGSMDIAYQLDENKQTLTWQRSWDGDPVTDIYTVYYEVYTCVRNCS